MDDHLPHARIGDDPQCLRCGKCCHFEIEGRLFKCKYLIEFKNSNLTLCRIYHNRLGVQIYQGIYCNRRQDTPYIFEGCPYNLFCTPATQSKQKQE